MRDKLEFNCCNRNEDCDNATICPCLLFTNPDIFREYTKEEQGSVNKYIKEHSIDTELETRMV